MRNQLKASTSYVTLRTSLALALVTLGTSAPLPAGAESRAERSEEASRATEKRHCVASAVAMRAAEAQLSASATPAAPATCFDTFAAAISFATQSTVQLSPSASVSDVTEEMLSSSSTYVIAIEYDYDWYGGASITYTSDVKCDDGWILSVSSMPSGWNDSVSSALSFSGCNHSYHYEHSSFGGAVVDCGTSCGFIGSAMNNRTSSIRWTR